MAAKHEPILGPYKGLEPLVASRVRTFRALDTRSNRAVGLRLYPRHRAERATLRQLPAPSARLAHPHLCTIVDVFQHEHLNCLVAEYVDGHALAEHLRRGSVGDRLRIAVQLLVALSFADERDVVHGSLTPGQVM